MLLLFLCAGIGVLTNVCVVQGKIQGCTTLMQTKTIILNFLFLMQLLGNHANKTKGL